MKPVSLDRLLVFAAVSVAAMAPLGMARAQSFDPSTTFNPNNSEAESFNRGENISVLDRPRPDYQALGLHLGGFMVYPKIAVSGGYDDNVFAFAHNKLGDGVFTISPEVDFQSTWSRNALAGYVRDTQSLYTKYSSEDTNQYGAGLNGKFEFGESALTGGVDYGHYTLPREAANSGDLTSVHPIQYDFTALNVQLAHTFNRLRVSGRFDYQIYDYLNGKQTDGTPVFEKNLNHAVATFAAKAEYAVSPDTAFFIAASYNDRNYQLDPPTPGIPYNSDSHGYIFGGGFNFDITRLIRGEVQFGYMDQQYVSPLFSDIKGLSAKAQVQWFPTQLTTVTATALRAVGDSGIVNSAGYVNTTGGIRIDHELFRNVILTADATVTDNKYIGISRTDDLWSAGLSANWLLNRRLGLTFAYSYSTQRSSGADFGPSWTDNRLTATLVIQY